jgi:hypothetical protein
MQIGLVSYASIGLPTAPSGRGNSFGLYSPHLAARRESGGIRKRIRTDVNYRLTFTYAHEP